MLMQREAEFISLHAAQHERVLHYILRRVGDVHVARELTADVFRIASQKSDREPTTEVPWLFAVARNVIGNEYRGRQRRRELLIKLADGVRAAAGASTDEVEATVADILGTLRPKDREILMLHFWDKLPTAEIAASLGCTETMLECAFIGPRARSLRPCPQGSGPIKEPRQVNAPMDRIDELLASADPVRPSNAPRLDARAELRAALDGIPSLSAGGQDFVSKESRQRPHSWTAQRPWTVAVAAALLSALVVAAVVLAQTLAPLQPASPAISPTPTTSGTVTGSEGWRVVRLSTAQTGRASDPQIQTDLAPGFIAITDVPNENFDSISIKILRDRPTQDILAQIYYGKVLPQRDPRACVATPEDFVELDSEAVDLPANTDKPGTVSPRFAYRVVSGTGLRASFGITTLPPGNAADACTEYHHIDSLPDGTMLAVLDHFQFNGLTPGWLSTSISSLSPTFASLEEAQAFMGTEEYRTYKRMLTSVRIIHPEEETGNGQ